MTLNISDKCVIPRIQQSASDSFEDSHQYTEVEPCTYDLSLSEMILLSDCAAALS